MLAATDHHEVRTSNLRLEEIEEGEEAHRESEGDVLVLLLFYAHCH